MKVGSTTVENGANLSEIAHQYAHSLPRDEEEIINNMLREFKLNCISFTSDGHTIDAKSIDCIMPDQEEDLLIIPVYNNTPEQEKYIRDKRAEKYHKLKNPTRAMKKQELLQLIKEAEDDQEIDF